MTLWLGALGWTGPSEEHEGKGTERPKSVTLVFRARWFLGHTGVRGARWFLGHAGVRGKGGCRAKNKEKRGVGEDFCSLCFIGFEILVIFVARNDDSIGGRMMTH